MAGYKGHVAGAAVSCIVYVVILMILPGTLLMATSGVFSSWQMISALFVVAMLFGLWPDIDTNSMAQNIFFGIAFAFDILLIIFNYLEAAAYLGLLAMTPIVGRHRGWTHSRIAMILVPLPIVLVPYLRNHTVIDTSLIIYGAAVTGYFSHLLLDGLITKHIKITSNSGGW